jgi:hypothetical protein
MACRQCAEERGQGQEFCRSCFEIFPRPSRLRRLLRALGRAGEECPSTLTAARSPVTEHYELRDPTTGGTLRLGDAGELPDFAREAFEGAFADPPGTTRIETRQEFRVSDGPGNERTYRSLDEMPPELRALVEEALKRQ